MNVGIRFSDNDFHFTIQAFLTMLNLRPDFARTNEKLTKDQIVILFNELAPGIYMMFQNEFNGFYNTPEQEIARMKNYLRITPEKVFIEEELFEFLDKYDWDNGEFHYIIYGQINSL